MNDLKFTNAGDYMNADIKFDDLMYRAGLTAQGRWDEMDDYDRKAIEKFAQLIVAECADLCDRFQRRDVGMQPAECAGAIRKMFGVEQNE